MACRYNCHAGYSNWYFGWSAHKKSWRCDHNSMGCPGTWHGSYHLETHVTHGVGHAQGRIYDCNAGFSNWKQGWSNSKQEWCCTHEKRGCMKYHCDGDAPWQDFGSNSRGRLRHWRPQSSRRHRRKRRGNCDLEIVAVGDSVEKSFASGQHVGGSPETVAPRTAAFVRTLGPTHGPPAQVLRHGESGKSQLDGTPEPIAFFFGCGRSLGVLGMFWCASSWLMAPHM